MSTVPSIKILSCYSCVLPNSSQRLSILKITSYSSVLNKSHPCHSVLPQQQHSVASQEMLKKTDESHTVPYRSNLLALRDK